MADAEEPEGVFVTLESQVPQGEHFDRWNGVLLLVRKDCANVKFTTCFDKTHPFTENTLSFPVQIEILTLAKSSCVRVKVLRSSDQFTSRVQRVARAMRRRGGCGAAILCAGVLAVLTGYVWCSTARRGPCDDAGEGVPVRART